MEGLQFVSDLPYSPADVALYQQLKGVQPILGQAHDLLSAVPQRVPEDVLRLIGSPVMASAWTTYTGGRLEAAARYQRGAMHPPAAFPGRFLPRGSRHEPIDRGGLQIDWARHALEMAQPAETADNVPRRVNGSRLEVLCFSEATHTGRWNEAALREEAWELIRRDASAAFAWADQLWSSGQALPPVRPSLIEFGRELIDGFRGREVDALAVLLEVHDIVRRIEAHNALGIERVGIGIERGVWCEIGLLDLSVIKATELVQTARAIQELRTLYMRGFAPIVVNEWGCNTDGSHRQVAAWLWNALCDSSSRHENVPEASIENFLPLHRHDMGPLLAHEVDRVFREGCADKGLRIIIHDALREARPDRRVERLPVCLVPEWSAATVIKGPYDDHGTSIRVCPSVYGLMVRERQIVLPARGPYHRTDAFLLPWFKVVPD